ncbi:hypothetical protein [Paenibacillus periandrae]|uniref:hypothetical protein n=1 Tax=Paenibacillus periandrae TaxID=1761741 RepID=UPI001F08B6B9|nr:hypothetical protein [Paenibacillus periandrae]
MKEFIIVAAFVILGSFLSYNYINGDADTATTQTTRVADKQMLKLADVEKN